MDATQAKAALPGMFTLGNALAGFAAICLMCGAAPTPIEKTVACALILLGMLLDGFDGALARKFDVASPLGSMLDSLADLVTYGVAPVVVMFAIAPGPVVGLLGAFYFIAALLRLARFTVNAELDDASHRGFEGMPSTAAAGMLVSWLLVVVAGGATFLTPVLAPMAALLGLLMLSQLPYPHLVTLWRQGEWIWALPVGLAFLALLAPIKLTLGAALLMTAYTLSGMIIAIVESDDEDELAELPVE